MPDYVNTAVSTGATTSVPIVHNDSQWMWNISQITVTYSNPNDFPNVGITKNGVPYAGAAPMLPGPGVGFPNGGLSQTFAGDPSMWSEARDDVEVIVTQGSAGATITVYAQYAKYQSSDPSVQQFKNTG